MKRFIVLILLAGGIFFLNFLWSAAQTSGSQFLITWRAESYAPPDFNGKILPAANSLITAALELIQNGKIIDLSGQTIYWYANNEVMSGSVGVQRISFLAPKTAGGAVTLRVSVPDYGGGLFQTIDIPVARPEAVIASPFPDGRVSSRSITLAAYPYFFNIQDPRALAFSWNVNGEVPENSGDPQTLHISLGPTVSDGTTISVRLGIQNPASVFEGAQKNVNLVFGAQ